MRLLEGLIFPLPLILNVPLTLLNGVPLNGTVNWPPFMLVIPESFVKVPADEPGVNVPPVIVNVRLLLLMVPNNEMFPEVTIDMAICCEDAIDRVPELITAPVPEAVLFTFIVLPLAILIADPLPALTPLNA